MTRFDLSKLRTGELLAGGGGVALFGFLFLDWYGTGSGPIPGGPGGFSGWDSLGDVTGFIVALTSVSGVGLALLAASGQRINLPVQRGVITAGLGCLSVAIILWRMLAKSFGLDLDIGILLGLAAAVAIAVGALMALREDGFSILVPVSEGRWRSRG